MDQWNLFAGAELASEARVLGLDERLSPLLALAGAGAVLAESYRFYREGLTNCEMSRMTPATRTEALSGLVKNLEVSCANLHRAEERWRLVRDKIKGEVKV